MMGLIQRGQCNSIVADGSENNNGYEDYDDNCDDKVRGGRCSST